MFTKSASRCKFESTWCSFLNFAETIYYGKENMTEKFAGWRTLSFWLPLKPNLGQWIIFISCILWALGYTIHWSFVVHHWPEVLNNWCLLSLKMFWPFWSWYFLTLWSNKAFITLQSIHCSTSTLDFWLLHQIALLVLSQGALMAVFLWRQVVGSQ